MPAISLVTYARHTCKNRYINTLMFRLQKISCLRFEIITDPVAWCRFPYFKSRVHKKQSDRSVPQSAPEKGKRWRVTVRVISLQDTSESNTRNPSLRVITPDLVQPNLWIFSSPELSCALTFLSLPSTTYIQGRTSITVRYRPCRYLLHPRISPHTIY